MVIEILFKDIENGKLGSKNDNKIGVEFRMNVGAKITKNYHNAWTIF